MYKSSCLDLKNRLVSGRRHRVSSVRKEATVWEQRGGRSEDLERFHTMVQVDLLSIYTKSY